MLNKERVLIILLLLLMSILAYFLFFTGRSGFVDNNRLFADFVGTKELQDNAKKNLASKFTDLDSLNQKISVFEKARTTKELTVMQAEAYKSLVIQRDSIYAIYSELINGVNDKITTQVWNTLNEYIIAYGKEHRYDYIYGANGNGNLMYASDNKEITDDIIKYANDRYNNK